MHIDFNLFHSGYRLTDTFANSEDPVKMPLKVAFQLGLHCLLTTNLSSGTEIYGFISILTGNPFKYKMDYSILSVSSCIGKSIRIERVHCICFGSILSLLQLSINVKQALDELYFIV